MTNTTIARAVTAVLGCALTAAATIAGADDEWSLTSRTIAGLQTIEDAGDAESLERHGDGLQDGAVLESLEVQGGKGAGHFSVVGRDLGQLDQSLSVEAGVYGKFRTIINWNEQYRNYTDGTFLGTRVGAGYWSVADATQATLETGFVPLASDPAAGAQATLLDYLMNSQRVSLDQRRRTGSVAIEFSPIQGLGLRAGYRREDRDGLKAVGSGSYRRSATGANAIGGLGESFRTYGLEFPMPIDYRINTLSFGGDYQRDRWFVDIDFRHTQFDNGIERVLYDNPLLLVGQNNQVGGAALHQMVLPPEYRSDAYTLTAGLRDLPLRSRLTLTYSQDDTTQNAPFAPLTVNRALLDDAGAIVADLPLPASDLGGDVTTTVLNVVLSSRPIDPFTVNLRYNRYDYENDSRVITWDGWAGIGETTWKDYDGSNPLQLPYRNRVPEYTRTRIGLDGTWTFSSAVRLKGEFLSEQYDRNADRYADNDEDAFRLTMLAAPVEWATLKLGYRTASRDIDGEYAASLANGVQEEWEELRMFDQAERDRESWDAGVDLELGDRFTLGLSGSRIRDEYDEEFYGLHEAEGTHYGIDATVQFGARVNLAAYYSREELQSSQLNRTKSNATGGGAFAVPQNDWATNIEDQTDAYGIDIKVALLPERLALSVSADVAESTGRIDTSNTDFLAGTTVTGATAFAWPDTKVKTTQVEVRCEYTWSEQLAMAFKYFYLDQNVDDFATDNTQLYNGTAVDAQNNVQSHQVFMGANPFEYRANVFLVTMSYSFR